MGKKMRDEINLLQYAPIEQIERLILLEQESKRKQGENLLIYVSDKALAKEYKKRNPEPQINLFC
tara:strand:- start:1241 stop:1435 length:195 start_codon:yes stop_codon:yes gene_type:complete